MNKITTLVALVLFFAANVMAQITNKVSDAEVKGRQLAQKILVQQPVQDSTSTGHLIIRHHAVPPNQSAFQFQVIANPTNCQAVYEITNEENRVRLLIIHDPQGDQLFEIRDDTKIEREPTYPFAGSDFWLCDLGLEFLHWPQQKVLKQEIHGSCGCSVLESTNPDPSTNGYSRVLSWIDNDTLGIVEAYAYDAKGKQLKDFYPKDVKKVNGRWQVQTLVMENVQTRSKSLLEFDLKK